MGSVLCCMPDDGEAFCCFCLPWPFFNNSNSSRSIGRQRGDTRVAPDQGRITLTAPHGSQQQDSMDTFRCPPRPLPYDDPRFSHQSEQHPLVGGHDKDSTWCDKSSSPGGKDADDISNCTAVKDGASSVKHHSGSLDMGRTQVYDSSDIEDECPICLEEYDYENPQITLQCNHQFHLSCTYEWMERSEACPVCAKVMVFSEDK
ncbi:hypothetical protein ABZP36_017718 [Zizania latifolia]